jgi:uncharacterized protein YbaP (TraB family)
MKENSSFYVLLSTFLIFSGLAAGQKKAVKTANSEPATILWKISGKDCRQPSYLLGTFHLADAEWLYEYPEMKKVIDSTIFILTEAFTTAPSEPLSINESRLKAIPLLTAEQYKTLDSFFVARIGEGITNNPEAENMTVAEMGGAILSTLLLQSKGANGVTKSMDLDLFTLYQRLGRNADRLDRIKPTEFDSDNIEHAKQHLTRSLGYIKNSDKPGWNVYQTEGVEEEVAQYKNMKMPYHLGEQANFDTSNDFDFVPMEVRNREWMDKITANISMKPCLIAVGYAHLRYRTGLISLLREKGYTVEPVIFSKSH